MTSKRDPATIAVVEMIDLGEEVARLGLRCRVVMTPELSRASAAAALEMLRDALHATQEDPATRHFRAVALAGQHASSDSPPATMLREAQRFLARVRAGINGLSEGGSMLAEAISAALAKREPMIIVTTPDGIRALFQFRDRGDEPR